MKTRITVEEVINQRVGDIPSLQSAIGRQIAIEFWNAALASVVEEPVLTEEELIELGTGALEKFVDDREFDKSAIIWSPVVAKAFARAMVEVLAGHIPASKSAPQQEGGLTQDFLESIGVRDPGKNVSIIDMILTRHTQALEDKEAEAQKQYDALFEVSQIVTRQNRELTTLRAELAEHDRAYREAAKSHETELSDLTQQLSEAKISLGVEIDARTFQQDAIERLEFQLAEAKKGRYAIGEEIEVRNRGGGWNRRYVAISDTLTFVPLETRPNPIPTIEQMMEEWVMAFHKRTRLGLIEGYKQLIKLRETESIESLWRRDCKGGVK